MAGATLGGSPLDQCTAHNKAGQRCKNRASLGSTVCRMHGSGGGRPVVHGRYSKYLPQRLLRRYAHALSDKDLISLRDGMALIEIMILERLDAMDGKWDARLELELRALIQEQRQLAQAEAKRESDLAQNLTAKEANALLAFLVDTINRHVTERSAVARIASEIRSFLAGSACRPPR